MDADCTLAEPIPPKEDPQNYFIKLSCDGPVLGILLEHKKHRKKYTCQISHGDLQNTNSVPELSGSLIKALARRENYALQIAPLCNCLELEFSRGGQRIFFYAPEEQ